MGALWQLGQRNFHWKSFDVRVLTSCEEEMIHCIAFPLITLEAGVSIPITHGTGFQTGLESGAMARQKLKPSH
jgi:hypothetical protein